MPGAKPPAARPRPSGGMNANFGNFSGEHFDESVAAQAMQQKAASQQAAQPGNIPPGGMFGGGQNKPKSQPQPGNVSFKTEPKKIYEGLKEGLKSIFDLNAALGIDPIQDTPEQQVKKQQIHSRYNKLTQEEQAFARQKYSEEMKKQQEEAEQEKLKKQQEEEEKSRQPITPPSSPQKGPIGPAGSKKQKASQMVNQQRQGIGRMQGSN